MINELLLWNILDINVVIKWFHIDLLGKSMGGNNRFIAHSFWHGKTTFGLCWLCQLAVGAVVASYLEHI